MPDGAPIEVFVSYSHKDEGLRDALDTHLALLKRQHSIDAWHDRRIGAGREWAGAIDDHLSAAAIILLLVSADFLASDYCYDIEMKRALERHDVGAARVIPVILRAVDWQGAPFGKLTALPKDGVPVTSWPNQDEAFRDIALGIRRAVAELRAHSTGTAGALVGDPNSKQHAVPELLGNQLLPYWQHPTVVAATIGAVVLIAALGIGAWVWTEREPTPSAKVEGSGVANTGSMEVQGDIEIEGGGTVKAED